MKKKIRRGGRGKNRLCRFSDADKLSIYLSNIRGYVSKCVSFQNIISSVKPSVAVLNETHFKFGKKIKIQGYNSLSRNGQNKCMGGISTSIKNQDAMHTLKVKEGSDDYEFLITRHSQFVTPINVFNIYGEQEGRTDKDNIQNRWNRIMSEVVKIEAKNELLVLCGDLNKHVGDVVEGNHSKVTFGGQLIRDLLSTEKYILVNSNSTNKVEGGPFTRYPNCSAKKSCLDLFIISRELIKHVEKLVIDTNFTMTPCRPISRTKVVYPDHYASLLTFKNLPLKSKQKTGGPKFTMWNTNKEGDGTTTKE